MANLAIIPARGGSKRIPRKNIKDFFGKPVIAYSIETALKSGLFSEVMVSTDDSEIAELAKKYGAKVPFMRSEKNSDDFASTLDVINEVVVNYKKLENKSFENICCIYPAAPLIDSRQILEGFNKFISQEFDSVFPVFESTNPVWRGFEISNEGKAKLLWPEFSQSRSQDLKKVYFDAGQWYWIRFDSLKGSIFSDNSGIVLLKPEQVQDIDSESDWKLAELKYKLIHEA
ncbi:MAG: pseudaminic acid cytidylyltransferase [Bacteroidetes bacterium]|nr:MAG: pseudaminic acid cytidylyltransferase [Bacteroidota bacterium]